MNDLDSVTAKDRLNIKTPPYWNSHFISKQDSYHSYFLVTLHHCDVIMGSMASLITSLTSVYSTVHSGADKKKQSSVSLAFVRGIHRRPVNCHVAALPPTHMFTVTSLSNEGHCCCQAALITSWHRNRLTFSPNSHGKLHKDYRCVRRYLLTVCFKFS